ncbi:MAG: O-antigen ligase family protein [Thermoanaerobaculia bacterium]|nr:O-antigen ligase family protein [Thermoanaerobaculia bacterium]
MTNELPPKWLHWSYLILFAALPWSVDWPVGKSWNLTVPAEPLIAVCGLGLAVVVWRHGKINFSGLAWISLAWVAWQTVAAFFSTMPLVSWKYWLVETGQWGVFFIGLYLWPQWWPGLIRVFAVSMAGVALYVLIHHGIYYQFRPDQAVLAPMPFFADHTVYGVVVVMVVLGLSGVSVIIPTDKATNVRREGACRAPTPSPPPKGRGAWPRFIFGIPNWDGWEKRGQAPLPFGGGDGGGVFRALPFLFLLSLCLIFSRAAWLSLLLAAFFGVAVYFRKYWPWFLSAVLLAVSVSFIFREKISARVSADVSSLERWNRYSCAMRMAKDRPWTGFGPGTFQFQYLPYQKPDEMTRLSITEPISRRHSGNYGRGGGAHSEYLRALSETGWPGLICWLLLAGAGITAGIRLCRNENRLIWLALALSLLSFFLHGLFNNFLHDARVAALVWGQMAVLFAAAGRSPKAV